ncbi:NAD(P)H-binding protein [Caballeronia sp. dw_19]|uniref:NAD(P)H-binding protein n=1 Tax=Caballeronia sp. dw_19 TaxID=2719791 RepID=UPI001BD2188B|nr:NAD(P)H-binding protein [Caballeronia sp. dw_19]
MNTEPILVLGSTGKTGRRIAERLAARNLPVRHGSRSATRPFDWNDPSTWVPVLEGVKAVYVCYYPDLSVAGATNAIQSFTDLAVSSGVRRLVLLSGRGEPEAQRCEDIVRSSGVEWTLLRASWFAQNFSEAHFLEPIRDGEFALPVADIGEPFVDVEDIADVAIAALTQEGHAGQLYELTGPRLVTFAEAIAQIAQASGRPIRFTRVSMTEYAAALEEARLPAQIVELICYLFTDVLDGRNASVTDGIIRALGRAPRDFSDYVRETAATGIWGNG